MWRTLLRPVVLIPSAAFVAMMVLFALRDSPALWFALLIGGGAALPAIAMYFSRNSGEADASSGNTSKPE
ncbi:MAG: hypothetical protein VX529_02980 [Pseudomonadota bacterium]|nr:hypothetical protein [Pseudomonadota bacterium]